MKSAVIFDIKRFAVHDGPGIRTTIFFKGCPLACQWCHNPESQSPAIEHFATTRKIGEKVLPSVSGYGREASVTELVETAKRDRHFYESSGGGVTISGGEPFMQAEALLETGKALHDEGFHLAVDTCGYARAEKIRALIPYTSLFLYDLKIMDPGAHLDYTGQDNRLILDNARMLAGEGAILHIRIPVIPGVNDSDREIESMDRFIGELGTAVEAVHLLPYHRIASHKYRQMGLKEQLAATPAAGESELQKFEKILLREGRTVKRGG
ncbi:MAG: glycyl-radical enzyme activating protein [Bacteroidota bacterium]